MLYRGKIYTGRNGWRETKHLSFDVHVVITNIQTDKGKKALRLLCEAGDILSMKK